MTEPKKTMETKQREIKFRCWDRKKKKWENDFFIKNTGEILDHSKGWDLEENKDLVLQQFICLTDKNGKEIYEGDIVWEEFWNGGDGLNEPEDRDEFEGIVVYDIETAGFGLQTKICDGKGIEVGLNEKGEFIDLEIIGNIYENPELLQ
jgi:uncharacterized phage protein (TIGR01671 family)